MPALFEVCAVIVTMAVVIMAVETVRTLQRMGATAEEVRRLLPAVRQSLAHLDELAAETRAAIAPIQEITPAVRRMVGRFEVLGGRAANITATFLDEVEAPVVTALRVARGVRNGAAQLFQRWTNRSTQPHSPHNGGSPSE